MVFKSALEAKSEFFRMDLEGFAYQSPIEIIKGDMEAKMQEGVLRAVQKFDVNVDEEELRKALAYDRAQYEKGYADAMRFATDTDVGSKWIPVTERLPDLIPCKGGTAYSEAVNVLTSGRKVLTAIWDGTDFIADAEFWEAEGEDITHWTPVLLPLPVPPEEG